MTQSFTPALKRLLTAAGCKFVRAVKGHHEIWYSPVTELHFVLDSKITQESLSWATRYAAVIS